MLVIAACLALGACPDDPAEDEGWVPAFDVGDAGWLLTVWGPSHDDLWAGGGTVDGGALFHRDDTGWSPAELPDSTPLINWIHGLGASDITAVGDAGTVLRFDGTAWSPEVSGTEQNLWGVFVIAPNDRWAVGGNGRAAGDAVVLHDDGSGWAPVPVPELERPRVNAFFKVWAAAPDDVVIVGQRGAILRWDGSQLSEEHGGVGEDLISLWGTGKDHIVAVGGRSNGVITVWNGSGWTGRDLAPLPGLNGIWLHDTATAHVAGLDGTLARVDLGSSSYELEPSDTRTTFHSIFGDSDGHLTAVGGNLEAVSPPWFGIAYTRALARGE